MECIHSALQSRYTHNQLQITLLLCSVEANCKLSVCVFSYYSGNKHSKRLEGNSLKSICLGCTTIYHMTNYRTIDAAGYRHTHTCILPLRRVLLSPVETLFLCFKGDTFTWKQTEAIRPESIRIRERLVCVCVQWVNKWEWVRNLLCKWVKLKTGMSRNSCEFIRAHMCRQNIFLWYCKWEQSTRSHTVSFTLTADIQNACRFNLTIKSLLKPEIALHYTITQYRTSSNTLYTTSTSSPCCVTVSTAVNTQRLVCIIYLYQWCNLIKYINSSAALKFNF